MGKKKPLLHMYPLLMIGTVPSPVAVVSRGDGSIGYEVWKSAFAKDNSMILFEISTNPNWGRWKHLRCHPRLSNYLS